MLPLTTLALDVNAVELPAVAVKLKVISPFLEEPALITKSCMVPELFVMPVPLMLSESIEPEVIVKPLAPESKAIPLTCVSAERETDVWLLVANVAISFGTVIGIQLAASFQSLETGF